MEEENTKNKEGSVEAGGNKTSNAVAKKSKFKGVTIALIIALILIIGALETKGKINLFDSSPVVAVVNGEKITQAELDKRMEQILATPAAQGVDMSDPAISAELTEQVLEELISTKILLASAKESGISVTDEDVDAEIALIVEQLGGEEAFNTELANVNLTIAELQKNIHNQLTIQRYIDGNVVTEGLTATDEEIQTLYDQAVAAGGEVPQLEEVKTHIEAQIISQKQQEVAGEFIASLRAAALVEIK